MSYHDWEQSRRLRGESFACLILAAEERTFADVADTLRRHWAELFGADHEFDQSEAATLSAEFTAGACLMAAYNEADSTNERLLMAAFPALCAEFVARENAGGWLAGER